MKIENIEKIDHLMDFLFKKIKEKNISDEEFSTSEEIKNIAFEIIEIFKSENIKTTYQNLTNMNFHTLVKILNYNKYFKGFKHSEYLKTFKL